MKFKVVTADGVFKQSFFLSRFYSEQLKSA